MHRSLAKAPLRLILVIPFVIEIALAVGLVGWLAIRNGQEAVNQVTHQLREETTARINDEIEDLLSTTQVINQLTARTIERENLDLSDIRSIEPAYWDYISIFPGIRGLGAGNESGDILALFQRTQGGEIYYFLEYEDAETQGRYVSQQFDRQRQLINFSAVERQIDARERPWYQAAVKQGGAVWTDVYTSISEVEGHSLAINASRPIYDEAGELQGVVSVILDLGQVSELLDAIEFSSSGQVYILEANGNLIGSSDGRNPVIVNGEEAKRLPATASENPLIKASALYLEDLVEGDFRNIQEALQLEFELDGDRQFVQITPIRADEQLEWYTVVVAPESDFMALIYANTRTTIWLCVGALAVATVSGIVTARWLTAPLLQLNRAAKAIADGNLQPGQPSVPVAARTREVSELTRSFSQMTAQLHASFNQMQTLNAALADSESQLKQFLEALPIGVAVHEITGQLAYVNEFGRRLLHIEQVPEAAGEQLAQIFHMYDAERNAPYPTNEIPAIRALGGNYVRVENVELRNENQVISLEVSASPIFNDRGEIVYAIAAFQDISDRKQAEAQLIYNALHDALTELPNRSLLMNRLQLAIDRAQQTAAYQFAVLFLDLDQFKIINDSLGHLVGDQMLIVVAQKLQQLLRPTDLAARLGGDEFVILLEDIANIQAAVELAERILAEFEDTLAIDGRYVYITTSIGIVLGTAAYVEAADVLRDADIALYRAKGQGRAQYEIFDAEMHIQALKRMTLERDLRAAIAQRAFEIHYQPIVNLNTREILGFEALIRWRHPTQGFISPTEFVALAEEIGLIFQIDRWILEMACRQLFLWQQQFPNKADLRVSINLSGQDLRQKNLVETVQQVLQQTALSPAALTLEITESMIIENIETSIVTLQELQAIGVQISIDDFGTGYSSLSYLYNLPANFLKIDKSFVSNMHQGDKNYKIVQAIVALSRQLQLRAIAEGIETPQQMAWLQEVGCQIGQGYLLSRPLPPDQVADLLMQDSPHLREGE